MPSVERRAQLGLKSEQSPTPVPENIVRLNTPSWETTKGILELRTHNNERVNSFFFNHIDKIKAYYEEIYKKTINSEPVTKDIPTSVLYDELESVLPVNTLIYRTKSYSPLLRIVRETVTRKIERKSKGYRKHIREEKAAQRRNQPLG